MGGLFLAEPDQCQQCQGRCDKNGEYGPTEGFPSVRLCHDTYQDYRRRVVKQKPQYAKSKKIRAHCLRSRKAKRRSYGAAVAIATPPSAMPSPSVRRELAGGVPLRGARSSRCVRVKRRCQLAVRVAFHLPVRVPHCDCGFPMWIRMDIARRYPPLQLRIFRPHGPRGAPRGPRAGFRTLPYGIAWLAGKAAQWRLQALRRHGFQDVNRGVR